ncbi:hypothetical protein SO694_00193039 [Aureococcus anophagefferens]|uniref:Myotubularin phosphatase domain-containing protein n=1 Tax=Aureococcus anophagefferens TaxID=44056 RepID=A0ABR1FNY5_AURAN
MGKITSQVATLGSVGGLEEDASAEERVCGDCWATLGGAALGGDEARASTPVADGRDDATYAVTVVQAARLPLGKDAGLFGDFAAPAVGLRGVTVRGAPRRVHGAAAGDARPGLARDVRGRRRGPVEAAAYVDARDLRPKRAGPHGVKLPQSGPRDERVGACRAFLNGAPTQWLEIVGGAGEPGGLLRVGAARASPAKRQRRAAPRPPRCADIDGGSWPARLDALYPPGSAVHGACFVAFAPGPVAPLGEIASRPPTARPSSCPTRRASACGWKAPPPGSNTGALALCVVTRDFRKFEFTSRTATNRDFHWYRSEIRWRTREDRFHAGRRQGRDANRGGGRHRPGRGRRGGLGAPGGFFGETAHEAAAAARRAQEIPQGGEGSGPNAPDAGADVDLLAEFRRQGVLDDHRWRLTETNALYALCPTYPSTLVVPGATRRRVSRRRALAVQGARARAHVVQPGVGRADLPE